MAISGNIFKSAGGSNSGSDDIVGRFRSGYQANGRPVALESWRVTTADPSIADEVAEILSASEEVSEWETKSGETFQVFGSESEVEVIFDGPSAVRATLVLWSNKGGKIRETDGEYLIEDGKVTGKPDPDRDIPLPERKEMAKQGTGPAPSLQAYFRLASNPDLGKFKFFSGAWTAIDSFSDAELEMADIEGPVRATLKLVKVEWEDKKTGQTKSFTRPEITVLGPVEG